jgi:hypothetical protein
MLGVIVDSLFNVNRQSKVQECALENSPPTIKDAQTFKENYNHTAYLQKNSHTFEIVVNAL